MIPVDEYRTDPCGTLSIPYWKGKTIRVPEHMKIVHDRDYSPDTRYVDEPYFRLLHHLKGMPSADEAFRCMTATEEDIPLLADMINRCYDDLSVNVEQLTSYRCTAAFAPDLWLIVLDTQSGLPVGCGIADFDPEIREGVLEWIQVLPEQRGRGCGQFIVNELLRRMAARADFVTVSGRVNNATNPERLYRKCGFVGADVWHILTRK